MTFSSLRAACRRLTGIWRRRSLETMMAEEMQAHLDGLAERNLAAGMSPIEARQAALRAFGGVEQLKEEARDQRRAAWVEHIFQDARYGLRQLRKSPVFTAVAVLSLGLGIGVNTVIFSLVEAVLLRSLPVARPDELVLFQWTGPAATHPFRGRLERDPKTQQVTGNMFSALAFERFQQNQQTLSELFAFCPLSGPKVRVDGVTEKVELGQLVSGDYFAGLGVTTPLGRTLTAADNLPGAAPVVVLSDRYWRNRFQADPAVIGKSITVNEVSVTVVGVTQAGFLGALEIGESVDLSLPMALLPLVQPAMAEPMKRPGFIWWWQVMGRRKPGVTLEQVQANLDETFRASAREGLPPGPPKETGTPQLKLVSGAQGLGQARAVYARALMILIGLTVLVLLVACLNVANLLLARGMARRREIAVRLAMGAVRGRLIRQLLTESVLLTCLGGAVGLVLSVWGRDLLLILRQVGGAGFVLDLKINFPVFAFTAALAVGTGIVFGLAPALRATRVDLNAELQGGRRRAGSRLRLGSALMVAQVALVFVLLVGAGLFARTLHNVWQADPGYRREGLLFFGVDAVSAGYAAKEGTELHRRIAERIRRLPGIEAVSFSSMEPLTGAISRGNIALPGEAPVAGRDMVACFNSVEAGFFPALGMPLVAGRDLTMRDGRGAPPVAVVNQAMARKFFGDKDPVGRRFLVRRATFAQAQGMLEVEIVGIVRDAKYVDGRGPVLPTIYTPFDQDLSGLENFSEARFSVRASGGFEAAADSIRSAVRAIDPRLGPGEIRSHDDQSAWLYRQERLFARLSVFYGGFAVVLVSIGLFGLMSYAVLRRTGEIGIRVALGAWPGRVQAMIVAESLRLVLAGVVIGLAAATATVRLIRSFLFGLSPTDPLTYGGGALVLLAVTLLACWWPARRAGRVDPIVALRAD